MNVKGYIASAAVIAGAACVGISGSATGAIARVTAHSAAASCSTSIAIEGPFTGPVAQLGLEQLHFAELAVANDNKANHTSVTLAEGRHQLTPSIAVTKTNSIIASSAVAAVGPAGSLEGEAVGPLFARAGLAFISGSATLPALAASGKNKTFFRVMPDDNVQGPQDAH